MHDARALTESGLLDIEDDDPDRSPHPRHIADKGYTGLDLITPTKKPAGPPQTEANKICNRATGKSEDESNRPSLTSKTGTPSRPVTDDPSTPSRTPSQQHSE
ncbi:hypothetical protein [Propionibacterium acidifaciens]|uniref:hypothetical protein n=1 Tax=Propionibacterium acidifaciens TaxID=556499 RepID=UPI0036F3F74A